MIDNGGLRREFPFSPLEILQASGIECMNSSLTEARSSYTRRGCGVLPRTA